MDKYEIVRRIEDFAPLETQEDWDCSGWAVNVCGYDEIKKVMLCLTVNEDIVRQALEAGCDMIVSHHPLFYIPFNHSTFQPFNQINIYCAHTNMDKAKGGTTDTVIEKLGLSDYKINCGHEYLRIIEKRIGVNDFSKILKEISPNARLVNNNGVEELDKIAFCAGSGAEFIKSAQDMGVDCFVTGDLKYHAAFESKIVLYDIGHFESEILILPVFAGLIGDGVEIIYAKEKSPFICI